MRISAALGHSDLHIQLTYGSFFVFVHFQFASPGPAPLKQERCLWRAQSVLCRGFDRLWVRSRIDGGLWIVDDNDSDLSRLRPSGAAWVDVRCTNVTRLWELANSCFHRKAASAALLGVLSIRAPSRPWLGSVAMWRRHVL